MICLCDTNALVWWVHQSPKLTTAAYATLTDPANTILVSAATPWELSIKHRSGKLPEAEVIITSYSDTLTRLCCISLPMREDHALLAGRLDWSHKDPFDRMLAAQAILEGAVLVSADAVFATLPGLRRVW